MVAASLRHSICRSRSSSGPTDSRRRPAKRAACARCPLHAKRRSGRQTGRDRRAHGRCHQRVNRCSHTTRDGNGRWRARSRVDENRCARRPLTSIRLGPFRPYKRLTLEPHPRVSPGCRYEREYQSLSSCLGAPRATRAAVDPSRKEDWTCKFSTSGALLSMSVRM